MDKSLPTKQDSKSSTTPNPTLEFMKQNNLPMDRANYLAVAYMGNPPQEVDGEIEAEIPWEIKRKDQSSPVKPNENPAKASR